MDNNMDLSSLVSLIMQNPDIIAKIAALAKAQSITETESEAEDVPRQEIVEEENSAARAESEAVASKRKNRERLFSALRPYLSSERAKTLSSVEAMVAIIDSMKV